MPDLKKKIKEILLLSDLDVKLLLEGDIKAMAYRNRDAAVRLGIVYGIILVFILLFLSFLSFFGAFGKLVLIGTFFGLVSAAVFHYRDGVLSLTKYPLFSYSLIGIFSLIALSMLSSIFSQGSFLSVFLMILIIGGIAGGAYTLRQKAADFGLSVLQVVGACIMTGSLLLSLQIVGIQFSVDHELSMTSRQSEARRWRDAEQMHQQQASMKICSSEEECRKMNMKKNSYYAEYEEVAQDSCETAVAKDISGRFEWTVSAKDYKFDRYEVDVMKDEISLFGDRAQAIKNDGSKIKMSYACRYNTKRKTTRVSVQAANR